jgi:hypothetical protein
MALKKTIVFLVMGAALLALYIGYPYIRVILYSVSMPVSKISYKEVFRVSSPDSLVDAVLVQTNTDATTSYGYRIYIVPTGSQPKYDAENFRADHFQGWALNWKEPKLLEIKYDEARIFHFSNFWQSTNFKSGSYVVEIRLAPRSEIFSLSPRDRWVE